MLYRRNASARLRTSFCGYGVLQSKQCPSKAACISPLTGAQYTICSVRKIAENAPPSRPNSRCRDLQGQAPQSAPAALGVSAQSTPALQLLSWAAAANPLLRSAWNGYHSRASGRKHTPLVGYHSLLCSTRLWWLHTKPWIGDLEANVVLHRQCIVQAYPRNPMGGQKCYDALGKEQEIEAGAPGLNFAVDTREHGVPGTRGRFGVQHLLWAVGCHDAKGGRRPVGALAAQDAAGVHAQLVQLHLQW